MDKNDEIGTHTPSSSILGPLRINEHEMEWIFLLIHAADLVAWVIINHLLHSPTWEKRKLVYVLRNILGKTTASLLLLLLKAARTSWALSLQQQHTYRVIASLTLSSRLLFICPDLSGLKEQKLYRRSNVLRTHRSWKLVVLASVHALGGKGGRGRDCVGKCVAKNGLFFVDVKWKRDGERSSSRAASLPNVLYTCNTIAYNAQSATTYATTTYT